MDPWVRKIPREKEMTAHSSILAWEIPWTEEPGGLKCWTQLSDLTMTVYTLLLQKVESIILTNL